MAGKVLCKSLISPPNLYRCKKIGGSYFQLPDDQRPAAVGMGFSGLFFCLRVKGSGPLYACTCNGLLEKYLQIEATPRIAEPFLAQYVLRGAVPDLVTFSLITKSYCKQFRYQRVLDAVLVQMKALGVEASISFYEKLMIRVCASFGPVVAFDLLKRVRASHRVEMPLFCYNVLVPQFFKTKHIRDLRIGDVFVKVMLHMKRHRVFPDQILVDAFFKARYIYDGHLKRSEGIARQMFAEGIKIGVVQHEEW